ncbi:MAG: helix-turn-helix domain-containing protein [Phycisphaerae bacterium]|nr:helix-turn-helix domain-containing protein [Phycisphaerae bacterium]
MRPAVVSYKAQVRHDGRVHEVEVAELSVPRCEDCGELVFGNDTDEQISRALRHQLGLLQPEDVRAKRTELGLTQKALAESIGVAPETISRWESGVVIQTQAMNKLLRAYLYSAVARDVFDSVDGVAHMRCPEVEWPSIAATWMRAWGDTWPDANAPLDAYLPARCAPCAWDSPEDGQGTFPRDEPLRLVA